MILNSIKLYHLYVLSIYLFIYLFTTTVIALLLLLLLLSLLTMIWGSMLDFVHTNPIGPAFVYTCVSVCLHRHRYRYRYRHRHIMREALFPDRGQLRGVSAGRKTVYWFLASVHFIYGIGYLIHSIITLFTSFVNVLS